MFGLSALTKAINDLVAQLKILNTTSKACFNIEVEQTDLIRWINDATGSVAADIKRYVDASLQENTERAAEVMKELDTIEQDLGAAVEAASDV